MATEGIRVKEVHKDLPVCRVHQAYQALKVLKAKLL